MNQKTSPPFFEKGVERTKSAFLDRCANIPIDHITPLKLLRPAVKCSLKYLQILASAKEV